MVPELSQDMKYVGGQVLDIESEMPPVSDNETVLTAIRSQMNQLCEKLDMIANPITRESIRSVSDVDLLGYAAKLVWIARARRAV